MTISFILTDSACHLFQDFIVQLIHFNFLSFLGNLEISADIAYGNQLHKANVLLRTLFVKIKNCISQVSVIYPSLFLFFSVFSHFYLVHFLSEYVKCKLNMSGYMSTQLKSEDFKNSVYLRRPSLYILVILRYLSSFIFK